MSVVPLSPNSSRAERLEPSGLFDTRHGATECGVHPALVQYFLTTPPFLPFGMLMHVLCPRMLEVCNLLWIFIGSYS